MYIHNNATTASVTHCSLRCKHNLEELIEDMVSKLLLDGTLFAISAFVFVIWVLAVLEGHMEPADMRTFDREAECFEDAHEHPIKDYTAVCPFLAIDDDQCFCFVTQHLPGVKHVIPMGPQGADKNDMVCDIDHWGLIGGRTLPDSATG